MSKVSRERKEKWLGQQLDIQRQKAGFAPRVTKFNHLRKGVIERVYYNRLYDLVCESNQDMKGAAVIYCDNVADYYRHSWDKLYTEKLQYADNIFDEDKHWLNYLSNVAPPFKKMFFEFSGEKDTVMGPEYLLQSGMMRIPIDRLCRKANSYDGVAVNVVDADDTDDWRWLLELNFYSATVPIDQDIVDGYAAIPPDVVRERFFGFHPLEDVQTLFGTQRRVWVNADGSIQKIDDPAKKSFRDKDYSIEHQDSLIITLLSLMFMNCKNIRIVDEAVPTLQYQEKHSSSVRERIYYKVLKLSNSYAVRESDAGDSGDKQLLPLHMVRGNFAKYTDDAPLFGKYTGTFWRPAHVRGSILKGTTVKDYEAVALD